jgi:hypothetical protein
VAVLTLTLGAVAALAAACGCSGSGTKPASNAAPNGGQGGGAQAYVACLRQHGVNLPTPNGSRGPRPSNRPSPGASGGNRGGFGFGDQPPPGVDQQTWTQAQQACASVRPSPGAGRDNGAFTAYRNCLSDHGVTMNGRQDQLDQNDPKVAAALKACEPLRPTGGPGFRGSPSPSS